MEDSKLESAVPCLPDLIPGDSVFLLFYFILFICLLVKNTKHVTPNGIIAHLVSYQSFVILFLLVTCGTFC